ncbi:UPF0182 family protein [Protaetiibacter sp. SSC-01]|uniref:UPF0182 family membrane protein n=1 Tax=Protaetiibacter sp. SSC-01 TaxID=2759943 RepID=UPI001656908F|nr:UPF0182 family protein [Protaetiibacter sp. SSC-01]QNO38402.1 UPF0182 family protein [Protaetiibacter sp. SSC-01]
MTSASPSDVRSRGRSTAAIVIAILAVLVVGFLAFSYLYADVLWFDQLGFLGVLTTQWWAVAVMFLVGFAAMAIVMWVSIYIAFRSRPLYQKLGSQLDRYQQVVEPLRRLAMIGIPVLLGLFVGVSTAARWTTVLQFVNRTPFGEKDPQFGLDVSFFIYELPFYRGLVAYASAIVLISGLAAIATHYLYGGIRINGREVRVTRAARVQIAVTAAVYIALQAASIWLDQFATLTNDSGVVTGATYTDVNAGIPGRAILAGIAALVAVLFIVTAVIGRWRLPLIGTGLLIVSSLVVGTVYPAIVQRFTVDPNAKRVEAEYIQRAIDATRKAYGIDDIDVVSYDAVTTATEGQLKEDAQTTANIRILDPAIVGDTFKQLERVKQYYQFQNHLDVDRYEIDGQTQDTVIAVRELNPAGQSNKSWYNNTLVYTHGFGVVAAYGNKRTVDGQPEFLESGIPSQGELGEFQPRVYFGENSPVYSIVGAPADSTAIELDYPSGGEDSDVNATFTFDGDGGPVLDNVIKKLVYALKFQSADLLLSDAVTAESQILYDRNPLDRVKRVAPYLTLDTDTYPAVVDGKIVWIVDGYTTTADYPYSSIQQLSSTIADTYTPSPDFPLDDVNYIRNSVKATVDAYDGSVTLYAWDTEDPLLKTWQKIFPTTLKPASEMSDDLTAHVRYPADLFKVQRAILQTYHVDDAGTFYSGDDAWATPNDPTVPQAQAKSQPPYYLTMQVPGADKPSFSIYSTYIPQAQTGDAGQSILTGFLAANADAGEDYGKLTLLTLPKRDTVPGPGQVQNSFNTDTVVANEINILQRGDTTVVYGNLLTLPVGGGLLYVQPLYVKSTGETSYPLLRKVLVAFGDQVAFEDTLDQALDALFGGDSGAPAGDTDAEPEPGTDEPGTEEPGTGEPGTGSDADNAALQEALADYKKALDDRTKAYAEGDLVAAAEADQRMRDAIEAAIEAAG